MIKYLLISLWLVSNIALADSTSFIYAPDGSPAGTVLTFGPPPATIYYPIINPGR